MLIAARVSFFPLAECVLTSGCTKVQKPFKQIYESAHVGKKRISAIVCSKITNYTAYMCTWNNLELCMHDNKCFVTAN